MKKSLIIFVAMLLFGCQTRSNRPTKTITIAVHYPQKIDTLSFTGRLLTYQYMWRSGNFAIDTCQKSSWLASNNQYGCIWTIFQTNAPVQVLKYE